jgi:hypothetical protein
LQESKASVTPRTICYLVKKAETNWWPRLLKKEGKPPVFMKVDWDKWRNEDDEEAECESSGLGTVGTVFSSVRTDLTLRILQLVVTLVISTSRYGSDSIFRCLMK